MEGSIDGRRLPLQPQGASDANGIAACVRLGYVLTKAQMEALRHAPPTASRGAAVPAVWIDPGNMPDRLGIMQLILDGYALTAAELLALRVSSHGIGAEGVRAQGGGLIASADLANPAMSQRSAQSSSALIAPPLMSTTPEPATSLRLSTPCMDPQADLWQPWLTAPVDPEVAQSLTESQCQALFQMPFGAELSARSSNRQSRQSLRSEVRSSTAHHPQPHEFQPGAAALQGNCHPNERSTRQIRSPRTELETWWRQCNFSPANCNELSAALSLTWFDSDAPADQPGNGQLQRGGRHTTSNASLAESCYSTYSTYSMYSVPASCQPFRTTTAGREPGQPWQPQSPSRSAFAPSVVPLGFPTKLQPLRAMRLKHEVQAQAPISHAHSLNTSPRALRRDGANFPHLLLAPLPSSCSTSKEAKRTQGKRSPHRMNVVGAADSDNVKLHPLCQNGDISTTAGTATPRVLESCESMRALSPNFVSNFASNFASQPSLSQTPENRGVTGGGLFAGVGSASLSASSFMRSAPAPNRGTEKSRAGARQPASARVQLPTLSMAGMGSSLPSPPATARAKRVKTLASETSVQGFNQKATRHSTKSAAATTAAAAAAAAAAETGSCVPSSPRDFSLFLAESNERMHTLHAGLLRRTADVPVSALREDLDELEDVRLQRAMRRTPLTVARGIEPYQQVLRPQVFGRRNEEIVA